MMFNHSISTNKPRGDQDLLDKIYRTQRQMHQALNYNVQASHTLANGMGRVESLLQQLVDIQISNLRPALRQSGCEMPVTHPSQAVDEEQGLEYVEEPEPEPAPAPTREQYRVHFAD